MEKQYYENLFCPCGGRIEIKEHHKHYGIPTFCKSGHNRLLNEPKINTRLKEGRRPYEYNKEFLYLCGCEQILILKKRHSYEGIPNFISGHNGQFCKHTEETKLNLSLARKGIPRTEEVKRKVSEGNKSYHIAHPGEAKLRVAHRVGKPGHKHTEESKQKMSEIRKANNPWKGQKHSEETKKEWQRHVLGKIMLILAKNGLRSRN